MYTKYSMRCECIEYSFEDCQELFGTDLWMNRNGKSEPWAEFLFHPGKISRSCPDHGPPGVVTENAEAPGIHEILLLPR
jgi:hypothetical protein